MADMYLMYGLVERNSKQTPMSFSQ